MNQQELLNTQTNAEEADNLKSSSKPLIQREQIPNTPFWVIGNEEKGYFVIMGQYKIIETQKTKKMAINQLELDKWRIIIRIAGIIAETAIQEKTQRFEAYIDNNNEINRKFYKEFDQKIKTLIP